MAKTKTETKVEKKELVIEGIVTSARVGGTRFDETVKNRLSIKSETLPYEELEKAYANAGNKLTPTWLKDRNGYINLNSKFDIPVKTINNKILSFEEFTELTTAIGSTVKCAVVVKDGAIYPTAFVILEDGEEIDPFANL